MVDTSASQTHVMDAERGASMRFLDQVFRNREDQVFLVQFDSAVRIVQPLTAAVGKLQDALAFVDTETMNQLREHGGSTLLYDAVIQASNDIMQKRTGRKALVVLTDGVDFNSTYTLDEAVEAAQRSETLVYSILYTGYAGSGRRALERLSTESGGTFFEVTKKRTLDQVFAILQEELRTQYSIGYVSDKPVAFSNFRKIDLTARRPGLRVQSRKQYWPDRRRRA